MTNNPDILDLYVDMQRHLGVGDIKRARPSANLLAKQLNDAEGLGIAHDIQYRMHQSLAECGVNLKGN